MNLKNAVYRFVKANIYLGLIGVLVLALANAWMIASANGKMYDDLENIQARDVALVLGTSRSYDGKKENPFFTERIRAAAELYFSGKVKHIIVSGDNSNKNYNEPRDMRKALVKLGVPGECITMDFAGLRTLDSVLRCKEIFQQKKFIVVSQGFHNYRALFIANFHGIDAIAYNADYPENMSDKTLYREYLARPKALVDLYWLNAQPKYLGDKVNINLVP